MKNIVYQREAFEARVSYAAKCFMLGISSRSFDTCFEMGDGDLVVTALVRRAMKNPRLKEKIGRGWTDLQDGLPTRWVETAARYAHIPRRKLAEESRKQIQIFVDKYLKS